MSMAFVVGAAALDQARLPCRTTRVAAGSFTAPACGARHVCARVWMAADSSSASPEPNAKQAPVSESQSASPAPAEAKKDAAAGQGKTGAADKAGSEPELDVTPEALERDFVFSKGAASIVAAYLPAFVLLLRSLLLRSRQPGVGALRPMMAVALLLLNPDLASSAAIELTNAKGALQKASKRKALLRRVKPIIDKYKTMVVITCLLSAVGMSYAALNFDSLRRMALGAFVVVLGQNMFHALARVKILRDGSLRETSMNERIPVLSLNGVAMLLLLLVARGVEKAYTPAVVVFSAIVFIYVVIKKTLQLVERLILS
ncbi:hypothetical protein FVE85_7348 [Porphyridium purpureum]|uniref:Uncharacterized protein n=1 Tax=Porphyridium purpureum TaxID=35688 RepID=A0A5J4ZAI0_PORPP|nr:hypothetical protein FVE85_7348 [Porphyridium purpureum]|eukprot:POR9833..scf295_1